MNSHIRRATAGRVLAAGALLGLGACAHQHNPSQAAAAPAPAPASPPPAADAQALPAPPPVVEQAALDRLKAMSDQLAAAKALGFRARSTMETPGKTGQFLTRFVDTEVVLQRPDKLRANVQGDESGFQFFYDGANATALEPQRNLYATAAAPKTIDAMLPFVEQQAGIEFPSADLLNSNPYAELTRGLTHAIVVGPAKVGGVATEHFAFMTPESNWEIWIEPGLNALPRRVAVTYKTVANFPRFQVEYLNWNLKPKVDAATFTFNKPAGAKPIEFGAPGAQ